MATLAFSGCVLVTDSAYLRAPGSPDAAASSDVEALDSSAPDVDQRDESAHDRVVSLPDRVAVDASESDAPPISDGRTDVSLRDVLPTDLGMIDAVARDGPGPDACLLTGPERCDGVDNDCDGRTDEGTCGVLQCRVAVSRGLCCEIRPTCATADCAGMCFTFGSGATAVRGCCNLAPM